MKVWSNKTSNQQDPNLEKLLSLANAAKEYVEDEDGEIDISDCILKIQKLILISELIHEIFIVLNLLRITFQNYHIVQRKQFQNISKDLHIRVKKLSTH